MKRDAMKRLNPGKPWIPGLEWKTSLCGCTMLETDTGIQVL